jgi:hypothetical protein
MRLIYHLKYINISCIITLCSCTYAPKNTTIDNTYNARQMAVGVGDQPHDSMTSTTIEEEVAATPVPTPVPTTRPTPTASNYAPKQQNSNQSYRERRISELEPYAITQPTYNFITIGSSKKDVARIQGTPTKIEVLSDTYEIWSFQYATISFRNNKVIEWNDVLGSLLKVKYAY